MGRSLLLNVWLRRLLAAAVPSAPLDFPKAKQQPAAGQMILSPSDTLLGLLFRSSGGHLRAYCVSYQRFTKLLAES